MEKIEQESRNKAFEWLTGEVIPTGDINTKIIIVGYEKHDDLADAFTILVTKVLKDSYCTPILIGRAVFKN